VTRRGAFVALATAVSVALAAAFAVVALLPDRHADGAGAVASRGGPGGEAMAVDPRGGGSAWTYGMRLCVTDRAAPAVIQSVGPVRTIGSGFRFLGARLREFYPSRDHMPIISVSGYPPPAAHVPDATVEAVGARVTTLCSMEYPSDYTELLIGLGLTSDDGGGWKGVEVRYTAGGRSRTLVVDHDLLICGASVPDCSPPASSRWVRQPTLSWPGRSSEALRRE
jgi:hypothetical protein